MLHHEVHCSRKGRFTFVPASVMATLSAEQVATGLLLWFALTTQLDVNKAPCSCKYNVGHCLGDQRGNKLRDTNAWQVSKTVWHDGVIALLAACLDSPATRGASNQAIEQSFR